MTAQQYEALVVFVLILFAAVCLLTGLVVALIYRMTRYEGRLDRCSQLRRKV